MDDYLKALATYYKNRIEYIDSDNHPDIIDELIKKILPRDFDKKNPTLKSVDALLLSCQDDSFEQPFIQSCEYIERILNKIDDESTLLESIEIMTHARTKPLRVKTNKGTYYVKPFDASRLLGLELYSLLHSAPIFSEYWFTRNDIIETQIQGDHEFNIEPHILEKLKKTQSYQRGRIQSDIWLSKIGLGDIFPTPSFAGRLDNYLVLPDGQIAIIDFDCFDASIEPNAFEQRMEETANELSMTLEEYKHIYNSELSFFMTRLEQNKNEIDELLKAHEKEILVREPIKNIKESLNEL